MCVVCSAFGWPFGCVFFFFLCVFLRCAMFEEEMDSTRGNVIRPHFTFTISILECAVFLVNGFFCGAVFSFRNWV